MHLEAHGLYDALPIKFVEPPAVRKRKIPIQFDIERHEGYGFRADGSVYRFNYITAIRPQSMCEAEDNFKVEIDADGVYCIRNFHGGINATIKSGAFKNYENVWFSQPPLWFDTHSMDKYGSWTMKIKQTHSVGRPRISIFNEDGFGFRCRIKAGHYDSISKVIAQFNRSHRLETSELSNHKTVRIEEVKSGKFEPWPQSMIDDEVKRQVKQKLNESYGKIGHNTDVYSIDPDTFKPVKIPPLLSDESYFPAESMRKDWKHPYGNEIVKVVKNEFPLVHPIPAAPDFTEMLRLHNDATLKALGDFRSQNDMTNVVTLEDYLSQLDAPAEEEEISPELAEILQKLA